MPELPEVQTVVDDLNNYIIGKKIVGVNEYRSGTINRENGSLTIPAVIASVERRGKFIRINLDNNEIILIHLRMTGKLVFDTKVSNQLTHVRARFDFSDGTYLFFPDVRTFGTIEFYGVGVKPIKLDKLGVEPLSKKFSFSYMKSVLDKRNTNIKNFLLDQTIIAGLGNIYVNEVLYKTGINPFRKVNDLSDDEIKSLVKETKILLKKAIECNGTSISDYRRVDDKEGSFQNFLKIYGKEKCPCGNLISRVKQNGRSTFYCKICQK